MKIFLDIDGVMIPAKPWQRLEVLKDGFPAFSSIAVSALNKILEDTGAEVVLTSSHKSSYSENEWLFLFANRGIELKKIERLPTNDEFLSRSQEILKWFSKNPPLTPFVIIDDDKSLNELPFGLKSKVIFTAPMIGLTMELATEAIDVLMNHVSMRSHS